MIDIDITQVDVLLVLNNIPGNVTGWSEDSDCLAMPDSVELANTKKGATGMMCASSTGEKGGTVSIKVLPNAPLVDRMYAYIVLHKNSKIDIPVHLVVTNKRTGDTNVCMNGVLTKAPEGVGYGKGEASNMTYEFKFEKIVTVSLVKRDSFVATITGGLTGGN